MASTPQDASLTPNPEFALPADAATIERVAEALRGKGYDVHVAHDREDAKRRILGLVKVICAIGSQKLVPDLETAFRRIREYSYQLEDTRILEATGNHSGISKMLVFHREVRPGRISVVLIPEAIGF